MTQPTLHRELGDKVPLGHDPGEPVMRFRCPCGKRGTDAELLYSPEQNDRIPDGQQLPLYCPVCLRNGWEGWEWV